MKSGAKVLTSMSRYLTEPMVSGEGHTHAFLLVQKQLLVSMLLIIFFLFSSSLFSSPLSQEVNDTNHLKSNKLVSKQDAGYGAVGAKPIRVVYPVVMPPYAFEDDKGNAQGLAIDLLRLWSEKTGIEIQFISAPWNEGLAMMRDGRADIHASLYYTEERDAYLDYASIITSSQGNIFYHKNIVNINGLKDLKGYKVGAVLGGYHDEYIRKHLPEVHLVSYPEFPDMLDAVKKGDVSVFVEDLGATIYRLKERGIISEFRYKPDQFLYQNNLWIAVTKGNRDIAGAVRDGMDMITTEERAAIEEKWPITSNIKMQDTLLIGMYGDFEPLTFINTGGEPAGLFVDIWRLWAKRVGKKIIFRAYSWDESLVSLKNGEVDIQAGMSYSDSRSSWVDFSRPLYEVGSCFFYLREKKDYRYGIFAGKKIGAIKGSYQEEYLQKNHLPTDVMAFTSMEKMLRAVLSGEISACLAEYLSANALINRLGLSSKFNFEKPMHLSMKLRAGVLKGNTELLSIVDNGFAAITDKELAEIEKQWVPDSMDWALVWKWISIVGGVFLVILGSIFFWIRILNRPVKARTSELSESEMRFRAIFEQAAVGIANISPEGKFIRINQKYCDILGLSHSEMLKLTFQDITYSDDLNANVAGVNQLLSGEKDVYSTEKRYIRKNGELVWIHSTISLVRSKTDEPQWFVAVVRDISERKLAEEKLHKSEDEIRQLRDEYTHIARVSMLGELTASLAHELKQPLASIRNNAQAAQRFLAGDEPDIDELHEILKDIVKDNRRADDVICKLRALMRKDALKLVVLSINDVIDEVIPFVKSYDLVRGVSLKLEYDEDIQLVRGDKIQLQQVLLNLILNSTEALISENIKSCTIVVRTSQTDAQKVTVSVTDSGPGIDDEVMSNLFEPFYTTKKEGLGMGLAISRSIIEEHSGRLWAENNPEGGVTFYFTIPIDKESYV